ncbi:MAG: hypothetical protein ACK4TA_03680 [Saprospiraceae bacterium]
MATTMQETRFNRHRTGALAIFLMYASLAGLYIAVGAAVLIFQKYWRDFPVGMKIAFGVLCLLYGLFRLYRAYSNYQDKQADLE